MTFPKPKLLRPYKLHHLFAVLSLFACVRLMAQDIDRNCDPGVPQCRQLAEAVRAAQARLDDINAQIKELQSQLKNSSGPEKSGIISQVRALQRQRSQPAQNLTQKQSQLARCRAENIRPIAPATLRSAMIGTATLNVLLAQRPIRTATMALTPEEPVTLTFDRSRCDVSIGIPILSFPDSAQDGLGTIILGPDLSPQASSNAGRFHPLTGIMENIPLHLIVTVTADSLSLHRTSTITTTLSTPPPDAFSAGPLQPDGSLTLIGEFDLPTDIHILPTVNKFAYLTIQGRISPLP